MKFFKDARMSFNAFVGKIFPKDENKDGIPDAVDAIEKSVNALLQSISALTVSDVYDLCNTYTDSSLGGEEKRKLVFVALSNIVKKVVPWILNMAIEVAVGKIKLELEAKLKSDIK